MTLREHFRAYLTDNGFFDEDAEQVLTSVASEECFANGHFDRAANDLDPKTRAVLTLLVNSHAVQWIDKNKPLAWYRPVFA